jgi:sulfur-carrier protein
MANVRIPTPLRKYTQGKDEVEVAGSNVREVIDNLEASYPGIRERICDDKGAVRRFVNVFVADEDIRFLDNLDTSVGSSDAVDIIPAIAGGHDVA